MHMDALVAGSQFRGQFEQRLKNILDAVSKLKNGVSHEESFFIDVYRVYDKVKYNEHGRKDFFTDPEILRLHFTIKLE